MLSMPQMRSDDMLEVRKYDMDSTRNIDDLDEALRHARAGLKALEAARSAAADSGQIYPTHVYLAAVELAHAIEVGMKVALRSG
jgi:hypothetical protein